MSISQNFPEEGPSLNLNFAGSKTLDPRITFTRTSSATYMDDSGLIRVAPANSARFDHRFNSTTGEIESLGLLVEESRANLTTFSEQLDNARWATANLTLSTNSTETAAPDGSNNAEKVLETITNGTHHFCNFNAYSISSGTAYTASIFVKSINKQFVQLVFDDNATTNGGYVNFDLTSGIITASANYGTGASIAATITPYPNGWYRLSITSTAGTTSTFGRFSINAINSGSSGVFPGYVGNTSNGYYIWGAQLEVGTFPTSYIPTTTTTVTRTADNASMTGPNFSSWYNQNEGTFYANAKHDSLAIFGVLNRSIFCIVDTNYGYFNVLWDSTGRSSVILENPQGVYPVALSSGDVVNINDRRRFASAYRENDYAYTANGAAPSVDSSAPAPVTANKRMFIGTVNGSSWALNGTIAQLTYYPQRLQNSQLVTLTR